MAGDSKQFILGSYTIMMTCHKWTFCFIGPLHRVLWLWEYTPTLGKKKKNQQVADLQTFLEDCFFNTLRPRQNGRHFADAIFNYIFLNENIWIPIKISLKFVPKGPISNIPVLVQIMAWHRPGDKPSSESMLVSSPMFICITRPQWVNSSWTGIVFLVQLRL